MKALLGPAQCAAQHDVPEQPFPFSMAFQPIVDVHTGSVYAYEALARGAQGEPAATVLKRVTIANRNAFDYHCRAKAIGLAAHLGMTTTGARLCINLMLGTVRKPTTPVQQTVETAEKAGFPSGRLIFEISETESLRNRAHLCQLVGGRGRGFMVAIDDFGAGYSGLNRLADLPADVIKIDMQLTRNLMQRESAQAIIRCVVELARSLGCDVIAEGIENVDEYSALRRCGVHLMQGYLFARPEFEKLPLIKMPAIESSGRSAVEDARDLLLLESAWLTTAERGRAIIADATRGTNAN